MGPAGLKQGLDRPGGLFVLYSGNGLPPSRAEVLRTHLPECSVTSASDAAQSGAWRPFCQKGIKTGLEAGQQYTSPCSTDDRPRGRSTGLWAWVGLQGRPRAWVRGLEAPNPVLELGAVRVTGLEPRYRAWRPTVGPGRPTGLAGRPGRAKGPLVLGRALEGPTPRYRT